MKRETENANRIRLIVSALFNSPLGRKRCMMLDITSSSLCYLAHESRTLALMDHIDHFFLRAEAAHLSSRLCLRWSVTVYSRKYPSLNEVLAALISSFFTDEGKRVNTRLNLSGKSFISLRLNLFLACFVAMQFGQLLTHLDTTQQMINNSLKDNNTLLTQVRTSSSTEQRETRYCKSIVMLFPSSPPRQRMPQKSVGLAMCSTGTLVCSLL